MFDFHSKLFGEDEDLTIEILSPIEGEVVPLSQVTDPTFSQEILGPGVAIKPHKGRVVSPVKGMVNQVFKTNHAVVLTSEDGAEILIHIGIDTVKLNGQHFERKAIDGAQVNVGDVLVEFNEKAIGLAGYDTVVPIIICNSDKYEQFHGHTGGIVKEREAVMSFKRKGAREEF